MDGNGSENNNPRRNRGQMTEWEKRKDMLKQRIRNKLNNAYKPENDKEFDALANVVVYAFAITKRLQKSQILHNMHQTHSMQD